MKQRNYAEPMKQADEQENLISKITQHIGEYFKKDVSYLKSNSRLSSALPGVDSMKLFEMILYLEDCFHVSFDEAVMEHIETVGDLAQYVLQLQQGKSLSLAQ